MSAIPKGQRPRRTVAVALLALVAANAACLSAPNPTPAPGFGVDGTPRDSLLAYASSLSFDTTLAAGDEQPLPVRDSTGRIVPGPIVRIEPQRGAPYLTRKQLGSGRIIARYRAQGAYPLLGIPNGTSYVWADSVGGAWREVVIPENGQDQISIFPMTIETHSREYYGDRPVYAARWIVTGNPSVGCNKPCTQYGCCRCPQMTLE